MKNVLLYDCFSGISGDMHIGAMLDLGVPEDFLRAELNKLNVSEEFELVVQRGKKLGISGSQATVMLAPDAARPHRHLKDVNDVIRSAGYTSTVEDLAMKIFHLIGEAEAKIHDIPLEKVHFHEVGATDSIVDIAAAAICINYLQVDEVIVKPIEVGSGMVRCEHGLMPVPAPATAEILKGVPTHYGRVDGEATTPTGAAIIKAIATQYNERGDFVCHKVGYGVGQKDFSVPNILRVMLGELPERSNTHYQHEDNFEVSCNIDDMTAEAFEPLLAKLWGVGAKDVFHTPIAMKKSRPGTKLTCLVAEPELTALMNVLFHESTSIGARVHKVQKWMLPREQLLIPTSMGDVRVKVSALPDGSTRWKIEHDDIAALARANNSVNSYLNLKTQLQSEVAAFLDKPSPPQVNS